MTPINRAVVATIGSAVVMMLFQGARWIARMGGLWLVLWAAAGIVLLVVGMALATHLRARRDATEPWIEVPWEVRR